MTSSDRFNAFAAARGEGLHPKIRDLLERTVVSSVAVRRDGMLQAGPSPKWEMGVSHGPVMPLRVQNRPASPTHAGDADTPQTVKGVSLLERTRKTIT
jgi:hypothetical protein